MLDTLIPSLWRTNRRKRDDHVELSPPTLMDRKRRSSECLLLALGSEGLVEDVDRFLEAIGGQLFAIGPDEVD